MPEPGNVSAALNHLNALAAGLFLLTAFGLIATRQALASVRLFVGQSLLLAASAAIWGVQHGSAHLLVVAALTIGTKALLIPRLLRRTLHEELYARREVSHVLNIPTSLLIGLGLTLFAYLIARPMSSVAAATVAVNLPIGLATLMIGAFTIAVRREAIPQTIGLLAMENGAFFAGVVLAPDLPLIAELAAAFDVMIVTLVMGLLARKIHQRLGATTVGTLTRLKEE